MRRALALILAWLLATTPALAWVKPADFLRTGTATPSSGSDGQVFWDSDDDTLYVYTGSAWAAQSGSGDLTAVQVGTEPGRLAVTSGTGPIPIVSMTDRVDVTGLDTTDLTSTSGTVTTLTATTLISDSVDGIDPSAHEARHETGGADALDDLTLTTLVATNATVTTLVSDSVDGRDPSVDGTKLDGIEAAAQADQTLSVTTGSGLAVTNTAGDYEVGIALAGATAGAMSIADKSKLDALGAGADVTDVAVGTEPGRLTVASGAGPIPTISMADRVDVAGLDTTDLTATSGTVTTLTATTIISDSVDGVDVSGHAARHVTGGGDTVADAVAAGNSGLMSGADKTKLDGIETAAQVLTWSNNGVSQGDVTVGVDGAGYLTSTLAAGSASLTAVNATHLGPASVSTVIPTDNHVLTYDSASAEWRGEAAGAASQSPWTGNIDAAGFTLSDSVGDVMIADSMAVTGHLDPAAGGTYNLGDATRYWSNVFANNLRHYQGNSYPNLTDSDGHVVLAISAPGNNNAFFLLGESAFTGDVAIAPNTVNAGLYLGGRTDLNTIDANSVHIYADGATLLTADDGAAVDVVTTAGKSLGTAGALYLLTQSIGQTAEITLTSASGYAGIDTSLGVVTVNIPDPTGVTGLILQIVDDGGNAGINAITVAPAGATNIVDSGTRAVAETDSIATNRGGRIYRSDGAIWRILGLF